MILHKLLFFKLPYRFLKKICCVDDVSSDFFSFVGTLLSGMQMGNL